MSKLDKAALDRTTLRNRLITAMSDEDFDLLSGSLTPVELKVGETLIEPDTQISHSWFIEDGICSVIAATAQGIQTEIGMIGRDGLIDSSAIHGTDRTPLLCFMQIGGHGLRLRTDTLRRATDQSASLRAILLAYAQSFLIQVAHTALSNVSHTISQRLARWLLMSQDRLGIPQVRLTHERLSLMLGVRRAGVTVAIQALERVGLVETRRGVLTIIDRAGLQTFAASSYGTPEAEYQRLLRIPIG